LAESLTTSFLPPIGRAHPIEAIELVPASGGVFDVFADETRLFSKSKVGRFPAAGEIEVEIRARLA